MSSTAAIITYYETHVRRAWTGLAALCALAVFAYGVFLLMAVAHAAKITQAHEERVLIATHLSDLESAYLQATQALTPERAAQLGFVTPQSVAVVYAPQQALTLNAR